METGRRGRPEREKQEAERHPLSGTGEGRPDTGHSEKTGLRVLEDIFRRTVLIEHRASVSGCTSSQSPEPRKASLPLLRAEACQHALADGLHDAEGERLGAPGGRRSFAFHRRREGDDNAGRRRDDDVTGGMLLQVRRTGAVPDRSRYAVLFGQRRRVRLRPVLHARDDTAHPGQHRSPSDVGEDGAAS